MTYAYILYLWALGARVLFVVLGGLVLWRGGRFEKIGLAILAGIWLLTELMIIIQGHSHIIGFSAMAASIDTSGLVAFVALSLWSRRLWTLLAAAFQLNAVASHLALYLAHSVDDFSYITSIEFWGWYALNLALFFGLWEHQSRLKLGID